MCCPFSWALSPPRPRPILPPRRRRATPRGAGRPPTQPPLLISTGLIFPTFVIIEDLLACLVIECPSVVTVRERTFIHAGMFVRSSLSCHVSTKLAEDGPFAGAGVVLGGVVYPDMSVAHRHPRLKVRRQDITHQRCGRVRAIFIVRSGGSVDKYTSAWGV